ncbi:MAG: HAD-IA family hydrolase [Bacteroidales bacterium]|nr:HAD-IA family hydrolase [Bacteroidales bacterium]
MTTRFSLVLFDLDGTLLDTLEDLAAAVNYALALRGLPCHSLEAVRSMVGHGIRNLVRQAMPEPLRADDACVDACLADFRTYYTTHIDVHTVPYSGMPELLAELDGVGVKLAVVSNKFQEGTEYLIRKFFPAVRFSSILGNRPGFPLKPDPAVVLEALTVADIPAESAVLVGDSATDMATAANGGIDRIAVSWGYRPVASLSATHIVHSVSELGSVLVPSN